MNPSFSIRSANTNPDNATLLAVIGTSGFSFLIINAEACVDTLVVYAFGRDENTTGIARQLPVIIQEEGLAAVNFSRTVLVWDFPEVITVPNELNNATANAGRLELLYGPSAAGRIRSDFVPAQHLHQVYRIPEIVLQALPASWQFVHQSHAWSLLSELLPAAGQQLQVLFSSSRMTVVLSQDKQLQFIQQFIYTNGEDAAYHLLNLAERFGLDPQQLNLELGGMIDEKSSLYESLYKYFLNIRFRALPETPVCPDASQTHPAHYFAHLIDFARCV